VQELPEGISTVDVETGESSVIYHDQLDILVPVTASQGPFRLSVTHQGCSEDGLCYPPSTTKFTVDPATPGALSAVHEQSSFLLSPESPFQAEPPVAASPIEESSLATATLQEGSLWKIALAFFVFGLLLAFTPCVLPMLPILSAIIAGEGETTRSRSFLLSLVYSGGLALVYTLLGIAAGLAGEGLAGFLQQPAVLVGFAVLLVVLSLSMFDVYQLQVPSSLQNSLNNASGRLKGGRIVGVFLMGAISALVIGPCVAAPLAGTLVYISQTKNVVLGGLALFSMAVGISVPLLLIGLSAGWLLPRAGAWMAGVKYVFGILLIAVAIWMVTPVFPASVLLFLWGVLAILSAVFLGVMNGLPENPQLAADSVWHSALLCLWSVCLSLQGLYRELGTRWNHFRKSVQVHPLAAKNRLPCALPLCVPRLSSTVCCSRLPAPSCLIFTRTGVFPARSLSTEHSMTRLL